MYIAASLQVGKRPPEAIRRHTEGDGCREVQNQLLPIHALPRPGEYLEEGTTVAIDGQIHETAYFQPLRDDADVYFLPKIEAGLGGFAQSGQADVLP